MKSISHLERTIPCLALMLAALSALSPASSASPRKDIPELLPQRPAEGTPGHPIAFRDGVTFHWYSEGIIDESLESYWEDQQGLIMRIGPEVEYVRGIFVMPDGIGSPQMDWPSYEAYADAMDFATLTTQERDIPYGAILEAFAAGSPYSELAHAPFVVFGNSAGGRASIDVAMEYPERTICFLPNVVAPRRERGWDPPTPDYYGIPALFSTGQFDGLVPTSPLVNKRVVETARRLGAPWAWYLHESMGHETGYLSFMLFPYAETMIRLRYPDSADPRKGPVMLRPVNLETGYLVENRTEHDPRIWRKSDLEADFFPEIKPEQVGTLYQEHVSVRPGPPRIWSSADYPGDPEDAFWLASLDLAYLFRGVAAWGRRLHLEFADYAYERHTTEAPVFPPGDTVVFTCTIGDGFDWSFLELYRGADAVARVARAEVQDPERVTFSHTLEANGRLAQGFTVLAYDAFGELVEVSNPATLLALPE